MILKKCTACGEEKEVSEFYPRRDRNTLRPECKRCSISRSIKGRRKRGGDSKYVLKRYHDRREWNDELKNNSCVDCDRKFHPAAMHWDHLPEFDKFLEISQMLNRGFSKQKILDEIAKCELVCANCHAVRTYNRRMKGLAQHV